MMAFTFGQVYIDLIIGGQMVDKSRVRWGLCWQLCEAEPRVCLALLAASRVELLIAGMLWGLGGD